MSDNRLICAAFELKEGGKGVRFRVKWNGLDMPAFAVRYGGGVHAYLNQCGHVPVELDWQEGEFFDADRLYLVCATHGALYSPETGSCLSGRCSGKGLTMLPVEERQGSVYLLEHELNHDRTEQ